MKDLGQDFRRHLGQHEFELLEEDWLALLESPASPAELFDLAELAIRYAPAVTSIVLLRVLADWLAERSAYRWQLRVLRRLFDLDAEEADLPTRLADCYRRIHTDKDLLERLLQRAGLGYGAGLADALAAIDGYVKLLPGTVVLDPEIGPARVRTLDLLLNRVTIAGPGAREAVLDVVAAVGRVQPVQTDGFFELLLTDPDRLRAAATRNPGRVVRDLLADLRRPLGAQTIREQLAGVVPEDAWDGFWSRARRELDQDPHIASTTRPVRGYQWSDAPVEKKSTRPAASRDRNLGLSPDRLARMTRPELVEQYSSQHSLATRRQLVELVEAVRSNDVPEVLADFFCAGRDGRARNLIEERLRTLSAGAWRKLLARVLTSYRQVPDAFAWIAANLPRLEDVEPPAVLTRVLDLLESPDHRPQAVALRRALIADGGRLIATSLDALDSAGARRLLDRLGRIPGIEDYRRDDIVTMIHDRFPDLAAPAADSAILTTAAGLGRARENLGRLTREELPRAAEELGRARAHGDLSENYEYKAAKEKQARLMGQVQRLQAELGHTRLIRPDEVGCGKVAVGCRVQVEDGAGGISVFSILGPWDSDPDNGIISYLAPLGRMMLGRRIGDAFELDGRIYTVKDITVASFD
jgi:transcription elongation GreA/GreB family factor